MRRWLACGALVLCASAAHGHADEPTDTAKLFADATHALEEQHPGDAIDAFEALADRGVVDASASFDRGLAYAMRVHMNAERPGDLGRAAHGFEEACDLTRDPALKSDATRALAAVRSEVARRKAREGAAVDVEQRSSPWRSLTRTLSESGWSTLAATASLVLGCALFLRWLAQGSRMRAGANIALAASLPLMVMAALLARSARRDRLELQEAIVVSSSARPSDAHGIALPAENALPEAARVELVAQNGGWTEIRWGSMDAWVPAGTLRPLAKPQ